MPAFERELLSSLNLRKAVGELAGRRVHFNQTDPKRRWAVARQLGLRVAAKRPSRTRATLKGAALATLGALYEAIAARTGAKLSEVTKAGAIPAVPARRRGAGDAHADGSQPNYAFAIALEDETSATRDVFERVRDECVAGAERLCSVRNEKLV